MDINILRSLYTVLALLAFVVIAGWAWSGRNRQSFEEAAHLPLGDDQAHAGQARALGEHGA
ncbi:cbb3-type cytochrome oxidase subunit 3 [Comamonas flocculans]|uniref:CcoQ/FixQ family Cbb3-type cytochrome c oxidase assembly chaperone n=1 Tax=Comamonas flocculans TaxID=2597701 RepID=A0A5B8S0L6_9BURK|nr:CcoQ/FixQ family Cbb3-type cytochrome c oxidase assembly chaperone [Comamonas flocculans]QEA13897.1 CcoQ/FixQ family Cbb3-type cytochrome c oxidase assembly chaperone [Comamonas flocculans]